jgi:hypothetical protein
MLVGLNHEEVLQRLVQMADGLFIWATAYHFIKDGRPHARSRLDRIVKQQVLAAAFTGEYSLN